MQKALKHRLLRLKFSSHPPELFYFLLKTQDQLTKSIRGVPINNVAENCIFSGKICSYVASDCIYVVFFEEPSNKGEFDRKSRIYFI